MKADNEFIDYMMSFYGSGGIYGDFFKPPMTQEEAQKALGILRGLDPVRRQSHNEHGFEGGSIDRELARDIVWVQFRGVKASEVEYYPFLKPLMGWDDDDLVIREWCLACGQPAAHEVQTGEATATHPGYELEGIDNFWCGQHGGWTWHEPLSEGQMEAVLYRPGWRARYAPKSRAEQNGATTELSPERTAEMDRLDLERARKGS